MNENDQFETNLADSQASEVSPVSPADFPFQEYIDYQNELQAGCRSFWKSESGVLVYRRMRVSEVFSFGSRDMKKSLEWQLGALEKSMKFDADVPNFLEPWYGIGTVASAFGKDYTWYPGQAPAIKGKFPGTQEALEHGFIPVRDTKIGKHIIEMIEYFLDKTGGKLPMSYCDMQSPLNISENIVDINGLMTDVLLDPDSVKQLFDILADLMIDFTLLQRDMIGEELVFPGHGFASSKEFEGMGMSDDLFVMLSDEMYEELAMPYFEKAAAPFGPAVFHSCGNWSHRIPLIKRIRGLKMIDAAFSRATDPDPNPPEIFAENFAGSGIVVNARIVGGLNIIEEKVKKLWKPGMKLIVVTYCKTSEEQKQAYTLIHEICKD